MRKALVLLVFASCGDDAKKLPLDQFLAARHEAECARMTRCGLFTSESICNAYFRWPNEAALVEAVKQNITTYDGAAAFDCLDALAAVSCDKTQRDARETPTACAKVFRGRVADGATCAFGDECKSGACNDVPACTRDKCCRGSCGASAVALEGACQADAQCAAGYCHKTKVCRARIAENMACDDARGCDFGLFCVGVTELQAGTCRKLPLIGESCPYNLCADINATCSNFTCVALGLSGAACTVDTNCSPFAECDETAGACIETPTLGQTCDVYCAGESWCENNVCAAPMADGTMCSASDQCSSTYCQEGVVFDECAAVASCI